MTVWQSRAISLIQSINLFFSAKCVNSALDDTPSFLIKLVRYLPTVLTDIDS